MTSFARVRSGVAAATIILCCLAVADASARARRADGGGGVPELNVKSSCTDAQKFSVGSGDKDVAFKGCMQDETNAKNELVKRWSSFKPKNREDCVLQARAPSPSYVEVLTCLEMDLDVIKNAPKSGGKQVPQIGGPVAPGLSGPAPKT